MVPRKHDMYPANMFYVCATILAVLQIGDCLECYKCRSDYAVNPERNCWDPFYSAGTEVVNCTGLCVTVHATGTQKIIGHDAIVARDCDPGGINSCVLARRILEDMGAVIMTFECSTCNETRCNSGHLASPTFWATLLALGTVGLRLRA